MLKVDNISLYYGAAQALRGVSLSAEPGKVTCVLGRNGVGKTSLLRAMVGQYPIVGRFDHPRRQRHHRPQTLRARAGAASASCRRAARFFRC